jgi:hypothetical protein
MTPARRPREPASPSAPEATICEPPLTEPNPYHQAGTPPPSLAGLRQETMGALRPTALARSCPGPGGMRSRVETGRRLAHRAGQAYSPSVHGAAWGVMSLCLFP